MKATPLPPKVRKLKPKTPVHPKGRVGAPNKHPELVKVPCSVKLPRWLLRWMHTQEQSMAVMIEEALTEKHGIEPPKID